MATLDEIRLQQLLQPFSNQTGIMSSNNAIPMINNVPMINTGAVDQDLQNTDLVNQIIAANQAANANKLETFVEYDPAFGQLFFQREQDPNNPTNTLYAMKQDSSMLPSYGGVSGYRDVGIPQINNQVSKINNQVPFNFDTSYGVANEEDVKQEFLPDQKPSGIEKLFEFLGKLPTPFNLARRGLGSLRGLNDRMQNSDFGRSKTLVDYLDARKYGGIDARDRAAQQNMREARAIQTQVDRRGDSTSRVADRNRSSVTRSSAAKSKGVGGGGYTKSDSNRESYRG